MGPRLIVNPNVLLAPVADGYVVFDVAGERLYQLNPFAALLVELCDGSRTRDELATVVAPLVPEGAGESILAWLDEASANGLLVTPSEQIDAKLAPHSRTGRWRACTTGRPATWRGKNSGRVPLSIASGGTMSRVVASCGTSWRVGAHCWEPGGCPSGLRTVFGTGPR